MDWKEAAASRTQAAFAAEFPHYFLIGAQALRRPKRPQRTMSMSVKELEQLDQAATAAGGTPQRLVYPVKKTQPTFPSMISVGRTANNDIVIEDVQMSKFHALFRLRGETLELEDAGSQNGTRVGNDLLVKSTPREVHTGDVIWFGTLSFDLLDPRAAWAILK
jgi:hypothetical protein